jgi:hypothetical protein
MADKVTVNNTQAGGIGVLGLLTIIFTIAKLAGYIDWSWWIVLAPLWGPALFWFAFLIIVAIVLGIVALLDK